MTTDPTTGFRLGHGAAPAAGRAGPPDSGGACERPPAARARTSTLRLALCAATAMALVVMGAATPASAAGVPTTCDSTAVVAHALPSTVNIREVKVVKVKDAADGKPEEDHLEVFVGSGAVVDPSGIIVTNKHVIEDAALIQVTFPDGTQYSARLIAAAALMDLAVLKVDAPKPLPALRFGNSDHLKLGQPVLAVGNPLGIGTSVSSGVVSGLDRNLMRTPFDDYIQTDASINPGNSGGPLLDCNGNIIGVNTALFSNNKVLGSIGIGFSLPSNDVQFVTGRLLDPETANPSWIGLNLQDLSARLAAFFHRPSVDGAIVTGVDPDSPAARASLKPGDIILGADGIMLPDSRAVLRFILVQPIGEPISLSVWRQGQVMDLTVEGQRWPHIMALRGDILADPAAVERAAAVGVGVHLATLTPADRKQYKLADDVSGVLIDKVLPGSQAAEMGLKPGDVIEQVGDGPATTPQALDARLKYGDPAPDALLPLLVHTKDETRWYTMYVGRVDVTDLLVPPEFGQSPGGTRNVEAAQPQSPAGARSAEGAQPQSPGGAHNAEAAQPQTQRVP